MEGISEDTINFLKTNIEPWELVKEKFLSVRPYRLLLIKRHNYEKLFDEFKCLSSPRGIELIKLDFDHLYAENGHKLFLKWSSLKKKLIILLKEKRIYISSDQESGIL